MPAISVIDLQHYAEETVKDIVKTPRVVNVFVSEPVDECACVTVVALGLSGGEVASLHHALAKLCWDTGYAPSIVIAG